MPLANDVPALLKARFQTDDPTVIEPLVTLGWNAATTVMVVRDATPFDDNEQDNVPMWRLAAQVDAWNVVTAWLNVPHPNPKGWLGEVSGAAQAAWFEGQYPLAETLTRWLGRTDPAGQEARLRQALLAMSEHAPRSLNNIAGVSRPRTQTGLQRWHALGGQWSWALDGRGHGRHAMDLSAASPAVRWLYGLDANALDVLDEQQVPWTKGLGPHLNQAFVQWAQALISTRDPQRPQASTIMEDGLRLFIDLVRRVPMTDLADLGQAIPDLPSQCHEQRSWAGRGETWAQALAVAYEGRTLASSVETPTDTQKNRPRL